MPSPSKSLTLTSILPPQARQDARSLVPKGNVESLKFYKVMKAKDQELLKEETRELGAAILTHGASGLAIGEHLARINLLLTPYNGFYRYLKTFGMSERNAYRYINGYNNAKQHWPDNVLKAAITRGLKIVSDSDKRPLGKFTESVRVLPPPRNPDPAQANKYLNELVAHTKERRSRIAKKHGKDAAKKADVEIIIADPEVLLKVSYRQLAINLKRLPHNARSKRSWVDKYVGMMLTELGISHASFNAVAIPEDFRATRGRPKLVTADGGEAAEHEEGEKSATAS